MAERLAIFCSQCQTSLKDIEENCPKCSSTKKTIELLVDDEVTIRDQIRIIAKDDTLPKKKKTRIDYISGNEQSCNGDWVDKERIIDKINNRYFEEIKATKEILRNFVLKSYPNIKTMVTLNLTERNNASW